MTPETGGPGGFDRRAPVVVQWPMDREEAARVLGIAPGADPAELRSAYRRLILARHPDQAGHDQTAAAARIIEAYAVLRRDGPPTATAASSDRAPAPPSARRDPDGPDGPDGPAASGPGDDGGRSLVAVLGEDTLVVLGPPDRALRMLLDAAHDLGEVTYVDLGAGLVQMVVVFEGGPVCLLLVTMRRQAHRTRAHVDVDSLDATPPPPVAAVVALLAATVRRRAGAGPVER